MGEGRSAGRGRQGAGGAGDPLVQLQVLAAALAASVAACALVAWVMTSGVFGEAPAAGPPPAPWPGALVGLGALLLVVAPFLERGLARPRAGPSEPSPHLDFGRYRTAKIAGFALREAAGVLGLVVAVLTGDARWAWGLCLGALVLMALAWPRAADLGGAAGAVRPGGGAR